MTEHLELPLAVHYSTPHADAIAAFVAAQYGFAQLPAVKFLQRGFNDSFDVRTATDRYVLRLSGRRKRGEADVASETAFLDHLHRSGLPIAAPVELSDGGLFTRVLLPDGAKTAVLFRYVDGLEPAHLSTDHARAQGITLARIHAAATDYAQWGEGRYRLDLEHLLQGPLSTILSLQLLDAEDEASLSALASRLSAMVERLKALTWTRCHGDCHGGNARIATEGQLAGQAVFFDFDDGGPGYLAYDLAVFLWSASLQRQGFAVWHAFIDGYRSVRALATIDLEAARIFVPIRHFWLMGEYAGRVVEWGSQAVPKQWLKRQLEFMRAWEEEKLLPDIFNIQPE
ncbi:MULTISPECIES: phosphotransferase enzyme family protein [unclassified Sinorhizobium]|uniref:phosphotransferase enzyme family protein n=1 Tax=unclassified Sinorhizobium TaxID=2613772 RepID=UPI003524070C